MKKLFHGFGQGGEEAVPPWFLEGVLCSEQTSTQPPPRYKWSILDILGITI